ncbi:sodium/hydrogen exchanger family [Holotrichia oblita]|uniref:Sodium/hydrogen exchanger family n=1 Tax=Holotrichia oblita TaxID=644536 RepID=A0ACB9SWC8_HOLOL|nr:sodium/hydrogen exchanger family [Holotrichia oblita]
MVTVSLNSINGNTVPTEESHNMEKLDTKPNNRKKLLKKYRTLLDEKSDVITLILILLFCWVITYSIFGDQVGLDSQTFSLVILFLAAKIAGYLISLLKITPMAAMVVMGVILKNIGFIQLDANYTKFIAIFRVVYCQLAIMNIMLPTGLGLDFSSVRKMIWMVLNLATLPVLIEATGLILFSHFLLGLPWIWAILLGSLIAGVSLGVIVSCLFQLKDMAYGVNTGLHILVVAVSTINCVSCIAIFGILLGVVFSTDTLTMRILYGPIALIFGLAYGGSLGMICRYLPSSNEHYLVGLRTLLLGLGCLSGAYGGNALGYGAVGPLGCITAGFVASTGWRKQGWESSHPVRMNFVLLWRFFEPIVFSLLGIEIDLSILDGTTIIFCIITVAVPVLLRVVASFVSTYSSNFNLKENIFIAICWIPKTTLQAALGAVALDKARALNDDAMIYYATIVLVISVLSIVLTSPIGGVLIMRIGPKFLHRTIAENTII